MKKIIPVLLAGLSVLVGCSESKEDEAYFEVSPASPLVYQNIRIKNTRNVYEIILDVNDPNSLRIGLEADGTAWSYFSSPGFKTVRGEDSRNDVIPYEMTLPVRQTQDLEKIAKSFPEDAKRISNDDWINFFLPSLKPETRAEIDYFETFADLRGIFDTQPASVVRAISSEGYWLLLENTTLTGTSDTNGDGNPDYVGLPGLINPNVPVDMQQDIADQGFKSQSKQETLGTLLSVKPDTLTAMPGDPNYDPDMVLSNNNVMPTFIASITPDLIFNYIINGQQVTVGIYIGEPSAEDRTIIAAFNDSLAGAYNPQSVLILQPEKTAWEYRKDWDLKHQDNVTNNP